MANRVLLNNVDHHALKVIPRYSAEFGHAVNQVLVVPTEFEDAQREYPIFFRADDEGAFHAVAILGLDRGENLFLGEEGWQSRYIPAVMRRGPFFIGARDEEQSGEGRKEAAIYVDLDDPRISESEGEPLFLPHGGNSPYLEQVTEALHRVHEGLQVAPAMFAAFAEMNLIRPVAVDVEIGDGTRYNLPNLHSIDAEALRGLGGQELERLHRSGFLAAAILVRSSLANLNRLIELKNG